MTKLIIAILVCAFVLSPVTTYARGVEVEIISQQAIDDKCSDHGETINGCFFEKRADIYLSDELSKYAFRRVVMHELGHYLLAEAPLDIFRGFTRYDGRRNPPKERAAERFADYILSADVEERITKEERHLFNEALTGKYIND